MIESYSPAQLDRQSEKAADWFLIGSFVLLLIISDRFDAIPGLNDWGEVFVVVASVLSVALVFARLYFKQLFRARAGRKECERYGHYWDERMDKPGTYADGAFCERCFQLVEADEWQKISKNKN